VPSVGGREARMDEILNMVLKEIVRSGYEDLLAAGLVLTGGASLLPGLNEMAEHIFDLPVRHGAPLGVGGLSDVTNSPIFAVGVGLVIYGSRNGPGDSIYRKTGNVFGEFFKTIKKWFLEFF
jgi:cell division protein FtsA